ncbi:MAG: biotin transporter BioY [Clostridia bacterium]|nr:biotin transporter BioY [Clostridia bacterium]
MKTKKLVICALFTAIMCITAPFYFMIGPVPITFTLFALALSAFSAGSMSAAVSTAVYILIGLMGMPVFSGFKGGFSVIASPTGGFVFAYIFIALILGLCVKAKRKSTVVLLCTLALLVCYAFGTAWYMLITDASFVTALGVCIVPFIPFDIAKLYAAYVVAKAIRKRLKKQM